MWVSGHAARVQTQQQGYMTHRTGDAGSPPKSGVRGEPRSLPQTTNGAITMPGTPFHSAFRRKGKLNQHQAETSTMHWRHIERGWDVVSTTLHDEWDNATHPRNHDDFETTHVGNLDENSVPRFRPNNADEWEGFFRETTRMKTIFDRDAHEQFVSDFADTVDTNDAEAAASYLQDSFNAIYTFDGEFNGTGRYETCSHCNGTGTVCEADFCDTYCQEPEHDAKFVSDPGCYCTSCNHTHDDHSVECPECEGEGKIHKQQFSRRFPRDRDAFLSEEPSDKEIGVIQVTMNTRAGRGNPLTPRQVLALFSLLESSDTDTLISTAISYLEPVLETVEVTTEAEDGQEVTETKPDPRAIRKAKVKMTAALTDISEKQAKAQIPA